MSQSSEFTGACSHPNDPLCIKVASTDLAPEDGGSLGISVLLDWLLEKLTKRRVGYAKPTQAIITSNTCYTCAYPDCRVQLTIRANKNNI